MCTRNKIGGIVQFQYQKGRSGSSWLKLKPLTLTLTTLDHKKRRNVSRARGVMFVLFLLASGGCVALERLCL